MPLITITEPQPTLTIKPISNSANGVSQSVGRLLRENKKVIVFDDLSSLIENIK